MTIKDIAQAAGVSPATVSRIMNHKDGNISKETRERVLRVIKESGYVPYAKLRDRLMAGSTVIGLAIPTLGTHFYATFVSHLQILARQQGYSLSLSITQGDPEIEAQALGDFRSSKVAGVLLSPASQEGLRTLADLHGDGFAAVVLDHSVEDAVCPQIFRVHDRIAKRSTEYLLESCQHVGLVTRKECGAVMQGSIRSGFEAALLEANRPLDSSAQIYFGPNFDTAFDSLIESGTDGILCQDAEIAGQVYAAAEKKCLQIPEDLSVVAMESAPLAAQLKPALSCGFADPKEMAEAALDAILWQIQGRTPKFISQTIYCTPCLRQSIATREKHTPKIAIIGSMNMDVVLQVPHIPTAGETLLTGKLTVWPGGKGANQAIGVSRMGGNAHIIGCLGNDRYGKQMMEQLSAANVNTAGVTLTSEMPTGTAYINVSPDGGSAIVVHPGANGLVNYDYIRRHHALLRSADYCLVQMELPFEAVRETVRYCNAHGVRTILKPSPARFISDELLKGLHMLVPNEEEMEVLCPEPKDMEGKARQLLSKGVENIIITLGSQGCLWVSGAGAIPFPARPYPCVDSTGASDVFISCLSVMLAEGKGLPEAITAACCAASYSVSHEGVQDSIPERALLDDLIANSL